MKTTCQICARDIKANTGVIAHHGYQRPFGWRQQTASCFGARHLPYEKSCDAILPYLERLADWLTTQQNRLQEMMTNPPETLTESRLYGSYRDPAVFTKPEGFDPEKNLAWGAHRAYTYESEHASVTRQTKRNIKEIEGEIDFMQKRLADWKEVA